MHKTVYMVIPAAKIAGDTSKEHIDSIGEEIVRGGKDLAPGVDVRAKVHTL